MSLYLETNKIWKIELKDCHTEEDRVDLFQVISEEITRISIGHYTCLRIVLQFLFCVSWELLDSSLAVRCCNTGFFQWTGR